MTDEPGVTFDIYLRCAKGNHPLKATRNPRDDCFQLGVEPCDDCKAFFKQVPEAHKTALPDLFVKALLHTYVKSHSKEELFQLMNSCGIACLSTTPTREGGVAVQLVAWAYESVEE